MRVAPPPIIFERLKLPQQIVYRRKGIYRRVQIIKNIVQIIKNKIQIIAFIFAKFIYFAKQIMYLESPDHPLQNDI